jgi:3-dehydroquinate synthase
MGSGRVVEPAFVLRYAGEASSAVYCGSGLLASLGSLLWSLPSGAPSRVLVCSDANVDALHGELVAQILGASGMAAHRVTMPAGEPHKNLQAVAAIYARFAELRVERSDVLIALGGGVPGDLFGFVAATYLRGLRLVQIPTTLVAQVDSAIGGKVGVDLPEGKNMVGAFKHAELVVADVDLLHTLPEEEWIAGTAEVLKAGVIADAVLFERLEDSALQWRRRSMDLGPILAAAVAVKARFVQEDVFETGSRMFLNYGHTYGHAIEVAAGYGTLRHGEAIGWGMAMEARLAAGIGLMSDEDVARQDKVLRALGLLVPFAPPPVNVVLTHLYRDKKVRQGRVRWALPAGRIGSCVVRNDVPKDLVRTILEETFAGALTGWPPDEAGGHV